MKKCMGCDRNNDRGKVEFVGAFCRECYDKGSNVMVKEKARLEYVINEDLVAADLERLRLSNKVHIYLQKVNNKRLKQRHK